MPRTARSSSAAFLLAVLLLAARADGEMTTFQAGHAAALPGLPASGATSDLALVNLAGTAARCALAITSGGEALAPAITLTLAAGESRPYLDVLAGLTAAAPGEARAAVSCDRPFSVFAIVADAGSGRFDVVVPVAAGEPEAAAVRALAGTAAACSEGALCFDAPGLVHEPEEPGTWQDAVGRVAFPAPAGEAHRLRLSLDVKVGEWFTPEPSGKHLVYWFVVEKNLDMPGMLYFRGPGKNQAFGRHGIALKHGQKLKMIRPFSAEPGRTYRVVNDYDMRNRTITITVTDLTTGKVAVTLRGRTNVGSFALRPGRRLLVDMGFFPDKVPTEVPSYGWEYRDVHLEVFVRR